MVNLINQAGGMGNRYINVPSYQIAGSFNGKTPVSKTVIPFEGAIWVRIPDPLPYGESSLIGRAADCGSEGCGIISHLSPHMGAWRNR